MTGSAMLEIESKFDVDAHVCPPDLAALPGVATVDATRQVNLEATYFDTEGLDLLGLGITLRRRHGGDDEGWHLKLPDSRGRHELREPLTATTDDVPARFRHVLRGVVRDAPLVEVATLSTLRSSMRLRDEEGRVVAEFADDRVFAFGPRPVGHPSWREWELELRSDDAALANDAAHLLLDAGATASPSGSKLARALELRAARPAPRRRCPNATARNVLESALVAEARRLVQLDPLLRADRPDAIHQMRVSGRRIRAVLRCFARDFHGAGPHRMSAELGWLVHRLGGARDLEVLRQRVDAMVDRLDPPADESWIDEDLARQVAAATRVVADALGSERYLALLDGLRHPDSWLGWAGRSERPAAKELRGALRDEWRHLRAAAASAERCAGTEREQALHAVRRSAKRLRYATEAARPVFPRGADDLVKAMSDLQDVLGRHHDGAVTAQVLATLVRSQPTKEHEGTVGRLLTVLRHDATADERAYRRLESRMEHAASKRWWG